MGQQGMVHLPGVLEVTMCPLCMARQHLHRGLAILLLPLEAGQLLQATG